MFQYNTYVVVPVTCDYTARINRPGRFPINRDVAFVVDIRVGIVAVVMHEEAGSYVRQRPWIHGFCGIRMSRTRQIMRTFFNFFPR